MEISEAIFINGITLLAVINPPLQIPISGAMLKATKQKGKRKNCIITAIINGLYYGLFKPDKNIKARYV